MTHPYTQYIVNVQYSVLLSSVFPSRVQLLTYRCSYSLINAHTVPLYTPESLMLILEILY